MENPYPFELSKTYKYIVSGPELAPHIGKPYDKPERIYYLMWEEIPVPIEEFKGHNSIPVERIVEICAGISKEDEFYIEAKGSWGNSSLSLKKVIGIRPEYDAALKAYEKELKVWEAEKLLLPELKQLWIEWKRKQAVIDAEAEVIKLDEKLENIRSGAVMKSMEDMLEKARKDCLKRIDRLNKEKPGYGPR